MKFIEQGLFGSYYISPRNLALYRIFYCLFILFFSGLPCYSWLSNDFSYVFKPPVLSLANLLNEFPAKGFFISVSLVNLVSFFFMFWGLWTRFSSILFVLTSIIGFNFAYSFGKIDHTLLLYITPLFLAFAGWGRFFSMDRLLHPASCADAHTDVKDRRSFVVAVFALAIGFAFFSAGIVKLYAGWWHWDYEAIKSYLFYNYYIDERNKYLAGFFLQMDHHVVWKLMDYLTLIYEIGFLLSVIHIKYFRFFLVASVLFHFTVLLMFNIPFSTNLIAYLLFIDWEKLNCFLAKYPSRFFAFAKLKRPFFMASVLMLGYWFYTLFFIPDATWFSSLINIISRTFGNGSMPKGFICFVSIPVLLFLLFIHFAANRKSPDIAVREATSAH